MPAFGSSVVAIAAHCRRGSSRRMIPTGGPSRIRSAGLLARVAARAPARGEDRRSQRLAGADRLLPEHRRRRGAAAEYAGEGRRLDDQVASWVLGARAPERLIAA